MRRGQRIGVVIPALNEEGAIAKVIGDIPRWVDETVVADNGSSDRTAERARAATRIHQLVRDQIRDHAVDTW